MESREPNKATTPSPPSHSEKPGHATASCVRVCVTYLAGPDNRNDYVTFTSANQPL
jgi:hypothetical protein